MGLFAPGHREMPICDAPNCMGHVGKFASCRDEALYEISLDGMSCTGTTGDVEWHHHLAVVDVTTWSETDRTVRIGADPGYTIPPGVYLVWTLPSGLVEVQETTERQAEQIFSDVEREYGEWLES